MGGDFSRPVFEQLDQFFLAGQVFVADAEQCEVQRRGFCFAMCGVFAMTAAAVVVEDDAGDHVFRVNEQGAACEVCFARFGVRQQVAIVAGFVCAARVVSTFVEAFKVFDAEAVRHGDDVGVALYQFVQLFGDGFAAVDEGVDVFHRLLLIR